MTEQHHEAVMSGHGFYNKHSVLQAAAAELGVARLALAAGDVPVPALPQPLFLADYGCSQGQNSMLPIAAALEALRSRTDVPITVVHTDLPANDFSSVFEVLANDPASYLASDPDAYALAAGRSFYEEILAPGSIALGWSAITTHWLSELPSAVPGHLTAQMSSDPDVLTAFSGRAAQDWQDFLRARSAELCTGGRLVMVEPTLHPDGSIGSEPMMHLMDRVLGELVAEGRISEAEADATTLPTWIRSPEEYADPVEADPGLELVDARLVESLPSPMWLAFQQDRDAASYARASVDSMRAWSESMIAEGIGDPRARDAFYDRCRLLGEADPDLLHVQTAHIVLDIGRV